nr:MAG TPA: hypothetical protein [Caudoviricetes sp.]
MKLYKSLVYSQFSFHIIANLITKKRGETTTDNFCSRLYTIILLVIR